MDTVCGLSAGCETWYKQSCPYKTPVQRAWYWRWSLHDLPSHFDSWHNAGIAEDLFPWRSTEHRCLADYTMLLFFAVPSCGYLVVLGESFLTFHFCFCCHAWNSASWKGKLLSWVVNCHYRTRTAAQPRIHWRCWWRKRFISESFRQFSFSFFFNSSTGSPQDSSCRVRVAVLLALMRLLQLKTFAKCALDAVGSAMGTGKTD